MDPNLTKGESYWGVFVYNHIYKNCSKIVNVSEFCSFTEIFETCSLWMKTNLYKMLSLGLALT